MKSNCFGEYALDRLCNAESRKNWFPVAQRGFRDYIYPLRHMVRAPSRSYVVRAANPKTKRNRPARPPSTKVQAKKKARCRGKPGIAWRAAYIYMNIQVCFGYEHGHRPPILEKVRPPRPERVWSEVTPSSVPSVLRKMYRGRLGMYRVRVGLLARSEKPPGTP